MNKRYMKFIILLMTVLFLGHSGSWALPEAGRGQKPGPRLFKSAASKYVRTLCNIGNWSYWQYYDGKSGITPNGSSGGFYPRGTSGAIFQDGFVWAGHVVDPATGERITDQANGNSVRVGGFTYYIGTQPGWLDDNGSPVDPDDYRARMYRIRPDYETLSRAMVRQDASEIYEKSIATVTDAECDAVIAQYKLDWEEWPGDLGAPYEDVNENGAWDPGTDIPGIANADQVIWYVVNDSSVSTARELAKSDPIGMELQVTVWAYNQPNAALGQIMFKKYKLINKSPFQVDSMFVSQWCDPDLGEAGDDLVGCDSTLGIGFAYNGAAVDDKYAPFGIAPPSMGYDFFQGPIVDGVAGQDINKNGVDDAEDYAIFNLRKVGPGKINIPMTSFAYFINSGEIEDPDDATYDGTLQWWNLIRGFVTTVDIDNPTYFTAGSGPNEGDNTIFCLSGNPVTGEGDLDAQGSNFKPGDRRMCLNSGPFDMMPNDTQEVVVAILGGKGSDNISSVADLFNTDIVAQTLYDDLFATVPKAPAPPSVSVSPLETKVVLDWGTDMEAVAATEVDNIKTGYNFEGYNVYQIPSPSASLDQGVKVATFDKVNGVTTIMGNRFVPEYGQVVSIPVQKGLDNGIQRFIVIEEDYINNTPLYPGNNYYFVVTAYNYNENPQLIEDKALESGAIVHAVVPQGNVPGDAFVAEPLDVVESEHEKGMSDGIVKMYVVDPSKITGHDYSVDFYAVPETTYEEHDDGAVDTTLSEKILWSVTDQTDNKVKIKDMEIVADVEAVKDQPVFDGIQVRVSGPKPHIKEIVQLDGINGNVVDNNLWHSLNSSSHPEEGAPRFFIDSESGNMDGDGGSVNRFENMSPYDFEFVFGDSSVAWSYMNDVCLEEKVPFAVYRYDLEGNVERMYIAPHDGKIEGTYGVWDQGLATTYTATSGYESIYAYVSANNPYDPAKEQDYINANDITAAPSNTGWGHENNPFGYPMINRMILAMYPEGTEGFPANGTVFRINTYKPINSGEKFVFSTSDLAPTLDSKKLAKDAVEKISVFPNPYYAYNPEETSRFDRFVTFAHLPEKATIRIFNLAGVQVRKLEKDHSSQFYRWDLKNEENLPVASGLYVAYIDMPDLGKEKVLKMMIIQGEQILETY